MDATNYDLREKILVAAARSNSDPRTVNKYINGLPVRGHVRVRIARALAELGVEVPTPHVEAKAA